MRRFAGEAFGSRPRPPFSFVYGGRASADLLPAWKLRRSTEALDVNRVQRTLEWTDPATGLQVRCVAVEYRDYPTLEWTLYLRNEGTADTPLIERVEGLDWRFERGESGEFVINHQVGTLVARNDYEPLQTLLPPGANLALTPSHGRPCAGVLPYFNLQQPGGGVIAVVGWPGKWSADFRRDVARGLQVTAGQELVRCVLHPGEEIRAPLIVLQFWRGDGEAGRVRSQNIWRRWMVAHNVPRPGGKLPPPQMTPCSSHQFGEMIHANRDNQIFFIDRYIEERMKPDYWWMDAGWYVNKTGWPNTGTWEVDTRRFPGGLRAITDHAHSRAVKSLVWFEPERVTPGTWLYENHPEWLLGADGQQKLLDLGNTDARSWLADHIDHLLVEQGIDLYRQDFNIDPLPYWRANDAPDRQGITENRYVTGYLAYWDELRRRHPDMLIDSCASGGHRNDLETLRRAVPLLRSDYIQDAVGNQGHTYGLAFWVPFMGTGTDQTDAYDLRSAMAGCGFTPCWDMRDRTLPYDRLRKLVADWRAVAPDYMGDFYPLTPYNLADDRWIAWQFDRPEAGEGVVQAYRRAGCVGESLRLKLSGLDPAGSYRLTDMESGRTEEIRGDLLMERGFMVSVPNRPGAAWIVYRRAKQQSSSR